MPIYEYYCDACQRKYEELCAMGADMQKPCPTCGKPGKKMLSAFAFRSNSGDGAVGRSAGSGCSGCHSGSCASCGH